MPFHPNVDIGLPQPLALYDGDLSGGTNGAFGIANTAALVGVVLYAHVVLTGVRVRFGTVGGTGHYDVGLYDGFGVNGAPGVLLAHAAATATSLVTAIGSQTPALIGGNLSLAPGRYWLAVWVDNITDTLQRATGPNASMNVIIPLPANASSLAGLANNTFKPMILGILQGGWT